MVNWPLVCDGTRGYGWYRIALSGAIAAGGPMGDWHGARLVFYGAGTIDFIWQYQRGDFIAAVFDTVRRIQRLAAA